MYIKCSSAKSRSSLEDACANEQAKLEQELLPLSTVLVEIEKKIASGDPIPDFGTLTAWAAGEAERMGSPAGRKAGKRSNTAEINIKMEGESLCPFCKHQNGDRYLVYSEANSLMPSLRLALHIFILKGGIGNSMTAISSRALSQKRGMITDLLSVKGNCWELSSWCKLLNLFISKHHRSMIENTNLHIHQQ